MDGIDSQLEAWRERTLRRITETRVAGRDTRHSRVANLQAFRGLVNAEPHYTFGIKGVERFRFEEVLDAVASITECSRDPAVTAGGGYISPRSTLKAFEEAARRILGVARTGGTFLVGTGHPGSLPVFYLELVRLIRGWGGKVLEPARGAAVPPNLDLDYIEGVAVTTDRCSLMHTHDFRAMEIMLAETGPVDLVVADHGYAGAAINAQIPVVVLIDTNDAAPAVAKRMGADATVIPADDNRPLSCYRPLVESLREFAELAEPGLATAPAPAAVEREPELPDDLRERLRRAERLLLERDGSPAALDELVRSLAESYRDQFLQTQVGSEEDEALEPDPALELVLDKQLHDALVRAILARLRLSQPDLRSDQLLAYLERSARLVPSRTAA
jgi:Phosphatase